MQVIYCKAYAARKPGAATTSHSKTAHASCSIEITPMSQEPFNSSTAGNSQNSCPDILKLCSNKSRPPSWKRRALAMRSTEASNGKLTPCRLPSYSMRRYTACKQMPGITLPERLLTDRKQVSPLTVACSLKRSAVGQPPSSQTTSTQRTSMGQCRKKPRQSSCKGTSNWSRPASILLPRHGIFYSATFTKSPGLPKSGEQHPIRRKCLGCLSLHAMGSICVLGQPCCKDTEFLPAPASSLQPKRHVFKTRSAEDQEEHVGPDSRFF